MLAILDYDAGNIESVRLALRRVGGHPVIVRDADEAKGASRMVFPGVGTAGHCMANLAARGFDSFVRDAVRRGVPTLAICIGMQLLFDFSREDGGVAALGIMPGCATRFAPPDPRDKVPHMGWNRVDSMRRHPVLPDDRAGDDYYFVHSYHVEPARDDAPLPPGAAGNDAPALIYGRTAYAGLKFVSMAGKGSLFGTQFHPEKSGEAGLRLLRRFLQWNGTLSCCSND